MKVETFIRVIAMVVIAAAVFKEVDSGCVVACPKNGCIHNPESGWVDTVHKHIHFSKLTQLLKVTFLIEKLQCLPTMDCHLSTEIYRVSYAAYRTVREYYTTRCGWLKLKRCTESRTK